MSAILFSGFELIFVEYGKVGKIAFADVSPLRNGEPVGYAAGHFADRPRHSVAGAVEGVFEKFGEAVVNGGVLHAVRLDPGVSHIKAHIVAGEIADDLRRTVRPHVDTALEIAHFAEIEIGVDVGFSHFSGNLRHGLSLVSLVPLADVSNGDIIPAKAEKRDAHFGEQGKAEFVHRTAFFFRTERLIPRRHNDRDNGYAEQLAVYIKLRVHAVFPHPINDLLELILTAERAASNEDRVGVLELHVRAARDLFQLVERAEKVRPAKQGIGHGNGAACSRMHGHRKVIPLGETSDLFQLFDRNIQSRFVHQPERHAAGAFLQALLHGAEHLLLFGGRQIAAVKARDTGARGAMANENGDIAGGAAVCGVEQRAGRRVHAGLIPAVAEKPAADLIKIRRIRGESCGGKTAIAGDERGDALSDERLKKRPRILADSEPVVV